MNVTPPVVGWHGAVLRRDRRIQMRATGFERSGTSITHNLPPAFLVWKSKGMRESHCIACRARCGHTNRRRRTLFHRDGQDTHRFALASIGGMPANEFPRLVRAVDREHGHTVAGSAQRTCS